MVHKFQLYCSCIDCGIQTTAQNINKHWDKHHVPKGQCLECQKDLFTKNKFCSSSCSAIYGNRRKDYTKFKTGPKPGTVVRPRAERLYTVVSQCQICNRWFAGKHKTCSHKCKSALIGRKVRTAIANGSGGNKNRGRGRRSYLEASFESWLYANHSSIEFITEFPFRRDDENGYQKTYFGDFYFPKLSLVIELDGTQHNSADSKEYDADRDEYITSRYGVRIIRVTHAEYRSKSRVDEINEALSQNLLTS